MFKKDFFYLFFLFYVLSFSQEHLYNSLAISDSLKVNANTVIRLNEISVLLKSTNEMKVNEKRVITVLNKQGDKNVDAYVYYDNNVEILTLQALIYDEFGKLIKKIKKSDFKDVSAVSGGTLYTDSRVKHLDYTPINYPYTIEFTCEINTTNTAFIPSFRPINDFSVSVEESTYVIYYPENIPIRKKEINTGSVDITKEENEGRIFYKVKNISAFKSEDYSPPLVHITPCVLFASNQFSLEGVYAEVYNWDGFGKWYYDLIKPTCDLSEETKNLMKDLVKEDTSNIEKAKKIYQYVQNKVRYISVQEGIGGWKPFNASYVDRVGYGDCKALTNYTMALLKAVDVESNYSIIYAGKSQRSLQNDFASMQGNHVILSIPDGEETIWLECTSQKLPFGFIGDFTDDRDALVITPEGAKIKHTKKYKTEENKQYTNAKLVLNDYGGIMVNAEIISEGIQYNDKYWLETEAERDLDLHYKKRWGYINNISFDNFKITNDKTNIKFIENISFQAVNYTNTIGDRMLFSFNVLNKNINIPDKNKSRKHPLMINRGFVDIDEAEILLPQNYRVESLPNKSSIESKFGHYKAEIHLKNESTLIYKREFMVNDGEFPKEDYYEFRNFYKEVSKLDNLKIALIKK